MQSDKGNVDEAASDHRSHKDDAVDLDDLQLQAQGYTREMPRRFSFISLLSFGFSIMASWVGFVSLLLTTLTMGGPTTAFWAPVVAAVASFINAAGLAELSSAFPSSGGPYHFAFMIAPERVRAPVAFVTGWLNILAYLFTLASGVNFLSTTAVGLASIYHPTYIPQRWQAWLIYAFLVIFFTAVVTLWPASVPKTQSTFFWSSLIGLVVISATILAMSPSRASAESIFVSWGNTSGWDSGVTFLLAVGQSMWMFATVDSATHLAEEIPQPGKNVPLVMIVSIPVGFATCFLFSLATLFSCSDFTAVATSSVPMYEAFRQAVGSRGIALFFSIWMFFLYAGAGFGVITTAGRLIWAFSRDNGMPFSRVLGRINKRLEVPLYANLVACTFVVAFGAISIGSATAFNTFLSTAILFLNLSYAIPQVFLLGRNRNQKLPDRWFRLGNILGPFCNVFSIIWTSLYAVPYCFPLYLPVEVGTMNYLAVVFVGLLLLIGGVWYFGGQKKTFTGPNVLIGHPTARSHALGAGSYVSQA